MNCSDRAGWCGNCARCRVHSGEARRAMRGMVNGNRVPPAPAKGPGTELKNLLAELGLTPRSGCDCEARVASMNRWGISGTTANRAEVEAWLREEAARAGWGAKVKAAALAVKSGLAFAVNPLDPIPGILDESLRRCAPTDSSPAPDPSPSPDRR